MPNIFSTIVLVILGIAAYIFVEEEFIESIICTEKASPAQCECIRRTVAHNVDFLDKVRILYTGASKEELITYAGANQLLCAFVKDDDVDEGADKE